MSLSCSIEDGVLYVDSSTFKAHFVLWYHLKNELNDELKKLIQAMKERKAYGFSNRLGDNYIKTEDGFFSVDNNYYFQDNDAVHSLTVANEYVLPALEKIVN